MENDILLGLQKIRTPLMNGLMFCISALADFGIFPVLLTIVLIIVPRTRKLGLICATSLLITFIFNNLLLKNLVQRVRPYDAIMELTTTVRKPADWSFPSGHTGIAFSLASVIFLKTKKRLGIPAVIIAALIGFSRLYCGVHYPTDVLAGLFIGTSSGIASCILWNKIEKKKSLKFQENKNSSDDFKDSESSTSLSS